MVARRPTAERVEQAIRAVLPAGTPVDLDALNDELMRVDVGVGRLTVAWIGEGWLRDARSALSHATGRPAVLVARRMSPGARSAAADAHVGWVDESGAAEIALPGLLISKTGRKDPKVDRPVRWTPSVVGTAEALILGTRPTVAEVEQRTGLSTGSATNALRVLTALGLLRSDAARGRGSAREIPDRGRLLDAYAEAAIARTPALSLRVGTAGRDLIDELATLGEAWDAEGVAWAATGAAAASVLGPYLSEVGGLDVFVDAPTPATLDAIADRSGLRPIEGGRVLLRPFPTGVTRRLCGTASGLRVAPWPRVYADLRLTGVRGEEAAEHLREVVERA
ncbi:MAG TPA: hypothetical protein VMY34_00675 [Acidimicrobiales bacterium]|nr:hypothetical protein [Acidimicrobiales bacterium]